MKLKRIGNKNATAVEFVNGITVLFSYSTPVAAHVPTPVNGTCFIRTDKFWSVTTSRHINKWLDGAKAREVPQSELDNLVVS